MTLPHLRPRDWLSLAALTLAFGAGGAWTLTQSRLGKIEEKVDLLVCRVIPETLGCSVQDVAGGAVR